MSQYITSSKSCISLKQEKISKFIQRWSYVLLLQAPMSWAACTSNGIITNGTSPLTLNTLGCADDGAMQAQLVANNTLNVAGVAITAPITGSSIPWNLALQSGSVLTATSNGIVGIDGAGALPLTLTNYGTINSNLSGALLTAGANVTNYGTIIGDFNGLDISSANGGTVYSPVFNSIVNNYGTIAGGTAGIHLGLGGTVNNYSGTIAGLFAIETDASQGMINSGPITVNNQAIIGSLNLTNTGVIISAGGTVNNDSNGQILAGTYGVSVEGGNAIINNNGLIKASLGRGIKFDGLALSGIVNNGETGTISGLGTRSISFIVCPGVVNNAGTISGGTFATIHMQAGNSVVNNSGIIVGNVNFDASHNQFLMTAGQMTGQLLMGEGGSETASFQNVTDSNIGTISIFNGGGGGQDQLIFDHATHAGGADLINWETITLNNTADLVLTSTLNLGGLSGDLTATLNINNATLDANSLLNETIQSSGHPVLVINAGTINLASPAANNALNILGNYQGNSGLLDLNAVLNADGAPADKLVINGVNSGGNASGTSFIQVHNMGGVGAQTKANGILLVDATNHATTAANAFALNAPLRSGAYDYRLFRGGVDPSDPLFAEDWFLRSTFVIPPGPDTHFPIIGPELSVYASVMPTAMDIGRVTLGTLHERVGDETNLIQSNPGFIKGSWFRVLTQSYQEQYSSLADPKSSATVLGLQGGIDLYRAQSGFGVLNLLGFDLAYANSKPNIEGLITRQDNTRYIKTSTGAIHLNAKTGGLYWTQILPSGAYLDLVAQVSSYQGNAHSDRAFLGLEGSGSVESAEIGYPLRVLPQWILEPEVQLVHEYLSFKSNQDLYSLVNLGSTHAGIGRAGLRLQHKMEVNNRVIEPYLRANFWSVLSGDRASAVLYAGADSIATSAKIHWAQLGGGFTTQLKKELILYAYVDDLVNISGNHRSFEGIDGGLGIRVNWG